MHDHHLTDMVTLLAKKKLIKADQQEQAIEVLKKYWEDKIAIVWGAEDVIDAAKQQKKRMSKAKAIDILQEMLRHHDCEYGITWDTINANL
jgi:ribosomal protein L10